MVWPHSAATSAACDACVQQEVAGTAGHCLSLLFFNYLERQITSRRTPFDQVETETNYSSGLKKIFLCISA